MQDLTPGLAARMVSRRLPAGSDHSVYFMRDGPRTKVESAIERFLRSLRSG